MLPPLSIRLLTERLILRPPRTGDVGELRRVLRHNHTHLKPWNPAPRPGEDPTSITEVSNMVLRQRREWKNGRSFVFMLEAREEPARFVGKIALNGIMRGAMHGAYLGYWMDVDHQSSGLCTEGIRAVLDLAFVTAVTATTQFYLGSAIVPTQKTNEIPVARALFEKLDLDGRMVSLDALHTQNETARVLVLEHGADYLFTVKKNQSTLHNTLQAFLDTPPAHFFS